MTARLRGATLAQLDVELVRRWGLREFVKLAWPVVDTSELQWNWHHDAICDHLEAVTRREIRDLVINQPPGTSKSMLCSILWPAWVWIIEPDHRWLCASHNDTLSKTFARKMRTLIETQWWRERWPQIGFTRERDASVAVSFYENTLKGTRASVTVPSAQPTGGHADTHVYDDSNNPEDAAARTGIALEATTRWAAETMATRFRDQTRRARVNVMQRLDDRDLAAVMIREGATVLCLPMRYESSHPQRYARDPRTVDGELLDAKRFPEEIVRALETTLGPFAAAAQLQQRPTPAGGGVFKLEWFKRWTELPEGGTFALSIDCTFKETASGSYVSIQCWYSAGPNYYLVDRHHERMDITRTMAAVVAMSARWPRAYAKLVEAKANGQAVVDMLSSHLQGLTLVEPDGGKEARANACQPLVASGNVFVPSTDTQCPARYPDGRGVQTWVDTEYLPEMASFPRGQNDDDVDATTQYLNHAAPSTNAVSIWQQAMQAAFGKGT